MDILGSVAENKIQEALRQGLFDNLPGRGRPLPLEDLSGVPDDLRLGYKILKDAGVLPEELELKKDAARLRDLILSCADPEQRAALKRQLVDRELRFALMMERRGH